VATPFIQLEVSLVDPKHLPPPMDVAGGGVLASAMFSEGCSANIDLLLPDRYGSSNVLRDY
jgi:hypothetical protein